MKKILENGQWIAIIAAGRLFMSSIILFLYGVYVLIVAILDIVQNYSTLNSAVVVAKFIGILDIHLPAIILLIFSVGLYELFVSPLQVPEWLKIKNIDDLKSRLASVIVMILAITFTKEFVEWRNPLETLHYAIATTLVGGMLIFYIKERPKI